MLVVLEMDKTDGSSWKSEVPISTFDSRLYFQSTGRVDGAHRSQCAPCLILWHVGNMNGDQNSMSIHPH